MKDEVSLNYMVGYRLSIGKKFIITSQSECTNRHLNLTSRKIIIYSLICNINFITKIDILHHCTFLKLNCK